MFNGSWACPSVGRAGRWPVSIEPAVPAVGRRGGETLDRRDAGVGGRASSVRLSTDLGVAATSGLEGESKTHLSAVGSGRAESATETAKTTAFGPQREQLRSAQGGAQGPRMDMGLHPRSDDQRPGDEVAVDRRRGVPRAVPVGWENGGPLAGIPYAGPRETKSGCCA